MAYLQDSDPKLVRVLYEGSHPRRALVEHPSVWTQERTAELQWPEEDLMGNLSWISTRLRSTDSSDQLLLFCSQPSEQKAKSVCLPAPSRIWAWESACFVQEPYSQREAHQVMDPMESPPRRSGWSLVRMSGESTWPAASLSMKDNHKRSWC